MIFQFWDISVFVQFYINGRNKFFTLHIILIPIFYFLGDYIAIKFFRNPLKPLFIITFIFQFYLNIGISVYGDIDDVKNNWDNKTTKIIFNSNIDLQNVDKLKVIGFSDEYVYLLDSIDNQSITIKKEKVEFYKNNLK